MNGILKINLKDLSQQMILELQQQFGQSAEVEIKVSDYSTTKPIFKETNFWTIIEQLDWSKSEIADILAPAVSQLVSLCLTENTFKKKRKIKKLFNHSVVARLVIR